MASIKVKFRPSLKKEEEGKIYYQLIHQRVVRLIKTNLSVKSSEWDDTRGRLIISECSVERADYLREVMAKIESDLDNIRKCIIYLETTRKKFSVNDIKQYVSKSGERQSFFSYMHKIIHQLYDTGHYRLHEIYTTTYNSLQRFNCGRDMLFSEFNAKTMLAYEGWLKERVSANTSSFYMRNLRAVYNRAVDEGLTEQRNPFKHVYTGIDKTKKRAVPLKVIRELKNLNLEDAPRLAFARDMFLFSFYTRGMAFVDMAYLKKSDLSLGCLVYCRRKTGQKLYIKWERCMQEIVDRYAAADTMFLLPIIKRTGTLERNDYRNMSSKLNECLKKISKRLGLSVPITMYVSRHTWASVAKSKNVPLSVISEGMGHDSEATTRIYLSALDTYAIDRANKLILSAL